MRLFGLSSLDTLLSLLLVELTWWGTVFFGQTLPYFIHVLVEHFYPSPSRVETDRDRNHFEDTQSGGFNGDAETELRFTESKYGNPPREKWTTELTFHTVFVLLLFVRLKTPLLLLVAVLKNKVNEHCQLLRIWFWSTIILDVSLFVFIGILNARTLDIGRILASFLFAALPFFIFRTIFWSLAKEMVGELSVKENSLFPAIGFKGVFLYLGSNVPNALQVFLTWEILINFAVVFFSVFSFVEDLLFWGTSPYNWAVVATNMGLNAAYYAWDPVITLLCLGRVLAIIGITTASLIGVNKEWRSAMKVLVVLYILFGLVGPLVLFGFLVKESLSWITLFENEQPSLTIVRYIGVGINIGLEIGQTILKLFLIEFTFKFCMSPFIENEDQSALRQPLLREEFVKEK